MQKREAPTISTERLILRRRIETDISYMIEMFNDENVRKYLGGVPPRDGHSMLVMVRHRRETDWAVSLAASGEFIGEVWFPSIINGTADEIGYEFRSNFWGMGYAHEAVSAVVDYAFSALRLTRIQATIDYRNKRSKKLIEKLGFHFAALLPQWGLDERVADLTFYYKDRMMQGSA
jgi:ribosomal-protein-alanine N-acetyltransferase